MALFQPFKATTRPPGSGLVQATYKQGLLDQQAKRDENAIRSATQTGIVGFGSGLNKMAGDPIGNYLREMLGTQSLGPSEDLPTDPNRVRGDALDPRLGKVDMGTKDAPRRLAPIQGGVTVPTSANVPTPPGGGGQPMTEFERLEQQINSGGDVGDLLPKTEAGGDNLFASTYSVPEDLTLGGSTDMGAQVGADVGGADSMRGDINSAIALLSGGGDAAVEAGTDAALEQGGEQALEAGAEEAVGSSTPGLGSVMSLAEGDVEGAAAKYALSMLPPPYNMLAMLV